jgi:hypothetical protein
MRQQHRPQDLGEYIRPVAQIHEVDPDLLGGTWFEGKADEADRAFFGR